MRRKPTLRPTTYRPWAPPARHGRLVVIELSEVFLVPAFDAYAEFQRRMLSIDGPAERLLTITSWPRMLRSRPSWRPACLRRSTGTTCRPLPPLRADKHLGVAVLGVVGALAALSALPGASGPKLSGTLATSADRLVMNVVSLLLLRAVARWL